MPTIALVANDRTVITSASSALKAEGYRISAYTDGASALRDFQTAPPDLAILDIKMPRLDGAEALRVVRAKSDVPVIFLTSTKEVFDEVVALEMGVGFHPQTVLAAPPGRAGQGPAAPSITKGRSRSEESHQWSFGVRPFAHGPGAPYLHLEKSPGKTYG